MHVDDFLWTGNKQMAKIMDALGKEFGFGSEEYDNFVFCGRRFKRQPGGAIHIDMMEYAAGLEPVTVPRNRRSAAHLPMNAYEWKQYQQVVGKLCWLVTELRVDYSYDLAVLQREKGRKKGPRASALIKAN